MPHHPHYHRRNFPIRALRLDYICMRCGCFCAQYIHTYNSSTIPNERNRLHSKHSYYITSPGKIFFKLHTEYIRLVSLCTTGKFVRGCRNHPGSRAVYSLRGEYRVLTMRIYVRSIVPHLVGIKAIATSPVRLLCTA